MAGWILSLPSLFSTLMDLMIKTNIGHHIVYACECDNLKSLKLLNQFAWLYFLLFSLLTYFVRGQIKNM